MQKGQVVVLILIGVLFVIVVTGGAFYLGRSVTPKPSPSPVITSQTLQPTPVSSPSDVNPTPVSEQLRFFRNDAGGYSFQYPQSFTVKTTGSTTEIAAGSLGFILMYKSSLQGFPGIQEWLRSNDTALRTKVIRIEDTRLGAVPAVLRWEEIPLIPSGSLLQVSVYAQVSDALFEIQGQPNADTRDNDRAMQDMVRVIRILLAGFTVDIP